MLARWSKQARKGQRANPVTNHGPANRKKLARLHRRMADYAAMEASWGTKAPPPGAYHRPGSMQ